MALTSMLETKSAEVYTLRSLLEELKNKLVVAESLVQEKEVLLADNAAALSKQLASENEALEEQRAAMTKRIKASEVAMQEAQEACEVTVQELKHKQQEEIDVIQEELDALKEAKKRTEEAMMQTAQALEEVRGQLVSITVERDETLQRTDELEKSHADLHTRLTDMTKQCESKAHELESETTRRATLEKDVAAQEEQITTMKAFVDELSATMHNLEQSKKDADKRATHAEARCEELSTELGTANSNSQETQRSHESLTTRVSELEADRQSVDEQRRDALERLKASEAKTSRVERQLKDKEDELATMKTFVDELSATMHNLEQSKKDADKRATDAEARCEELSTELGTANSNSQETQRSHESLTTRVSELEADRQSVDEQRRDALERLKASEAKYEEEMARRKEPSRVERQLKDKEDELATMKAFVDELSATMHNLEQSKKDADKRATDAEARCEELSSELGTANSNSQETQRSHESLTTRVSELEADRQSVDEQRRDALEKLKASEAKYEEEMARRKEPSRVERQLKDKEDELATMKAFVDELSATMHNLEQSKKDADKRATHAEARCEELSSELDIANQKNEKVSLSLSQTRGMLRREERMDREDKNMRGNSASTGVSTHDVAHATTQTHGSSARARSPRHTHETASSHLTRRVAELEEQCRALQMSEAAARVELSREIQGHEDLKLMMRHRAYIAEHDCEKLAAVRALDYLNEELLQTTLQLEKARAEKSAPSLWS
ncbi:hypothetical protein NFJ02_29g67950 [Pycnococcus provasolii]